MFGVASGKDFPGQLLIGDAVWLVSTGTASGLSLAYLIESWTPVPGMVLRGMVGSAIINDSLACIFTFVGSKYSPQLKFALELLTPQPVFGTKPEACLTSLSPVARSSWPLVLFTLPMLYWGKPVQNWTANMHKNYLYARDDRITCLRAVSLT